MKQLYMYDSPMYITKCVTNKSLKQCISTYLDYECNRGNWERTPLYQMNKKGILACINGEFDWSYDLKIPLRIFKEEMALVSENKLRSVFKSKQIRKKSPQHYRLRPKEPEGPPPSVPSIFDGMTICKNESEAQDEPITGTQPSRTYSLRPREPIGPPPPLPSIFDGMTVCFDERETQQNYFNRLSYIDVVRAFILYMENISRDKIAS